MPEFPVKDNCIIPCLSDSAIWSFFQMTAHNVGALLVVKSGEAKKLAGIITERG